MNRRTSIKGLLAFATIGVSSFSIYKWITPSRKISASTFHEKRILIAEIGEVIIPRTDTPGAKDAKVEDFVLKIIIQCADAKNQRKFIQGLEKLEEYTLKNFKSTFVECTPKQKIDVIKHWERDGLYSFAIFNKINNRLVGKPFFLQIKELVVEGYCTSELGATKGLTYEHNPGYYVACTSINKDQKSWATK